MQLYRYFVSQSSEFSRHNPLCYFSTSVYCCNRIFRYRLSPETFGYTLLYMKLSHDSHNFITLRVHVYLNVIRGVSHSFPHHPLWFIFYILKQRDLRWCDFKFCRHLWSVITFKGLCTCNTSGFLGHTVLKTIPVPEAVTDKNKLQYNSLRDIYVNSNDFLRGAIIIWIILKLRNSKFLLNIIGNRKYYMRK
jgi:hypothetical protein